MKKLIPLFRYALGLIFVVFGLNGFLQFIPMPQPSPAAGSFLGALAATGYFFPLLKLTEIAAGALLLANKFVLLALLILAPIAVNILAFHIFLDISGLPMAVFITVAGLVVAWSRKEDFAAVLKA